MFSVHTTPEKFENATITGHFGVVCEKKKKKKKLHQGSRIIVVTSSFSKNMKFQATVDCLDVKTKTSKVLAKTLLDLKC